MSKIAKVKYNDIVDGEGICVSLWMQGCPHHCKDCFNPETWNPDEGYEITDDLIPNIISAINANNVNRNFSVLGGEPLASYNQDFVLEVISKVRETYPDIKIYIWSGYTIEELLDMKSPVIDKILEKSNILIDGPFQWDKKDITLKLRGSLNQRIIDLTKLKNYDIIK